MDLVMKLLLLLLRLKAGEFSEGSGAELTH